jgi:hypothetical protein
MKGIDSTGAPLVHVPGRVDGWVDGWMEVKAGLRIAYSNQKLFIYEGSELKQKRLVAEYKSARQLEIQHKNFSSLVGLVIQFVDKSVI